MNRGALIFPEFIAFIATQAFTLSASDASTPELADLVISHGARVKQSALSSAIGNMLGRDVTPTTIVTFDEFQEASTRCYMPWCKDKQIVREMFTAISGGATTFTIQQLEAAM